MILVDANLLLYSEDSLSEFHERAQTWWDAQLSGSSPVCLSWQVMTAFIRISTNARLHHRPLTLKEAIERVRYSHQVGATRPFFSWADTSRTCSVYAATVCSRICSRCSRRSFAAWPPRPASTDRASAT